MTEPAKIWRCKNGHHMGQVIRNGSGVRVLLLYRQALDPEHTASQLEDVDIIAIVEGYTTDVSCSICNSIRSWIPGEEALQQLLDRALRYNEKASS